LFSLRLALALQRIAYPLFGIWTSPATDSVIAALFTVTSLVPSYVLRRGFELLARKRFVRECNART
jgi:hypothetical protein